MTGETDVPAAIRPFLGMVRNKQAVGFGDFNSEVVSRLNAHQRGVYWMNYDKVRLNPELIK